MKIRNVKVPEGINVSKHSPLADLLILTAGAIGIFAAIGLVALLIGSYAGRYMPMSWENAMAASVFEDETVTQIDAEHRDVESALQAIADRLSANMALPKGLHIKVHYLDDDVVNAFATLGGHVFVYRGLIAQMPQENALAMVLGHEIAHAANRDVAANMGGALLAQLALSAVMGASPDMTQNLIWGPNALLLQQFSRDAERRADSDGLATVAATYGHVAGADAFFRILLDQMGKSLPAEGPEFLSTHPLTESRIKALDALAREQGWATDGKTTPLPSVLQALAKSG
jgi:predicted Zn-dependent protease